MADAFMSSQSFSASELDYQDILSKLKSLIDSGNQTTEALRHAKTLDMMLLNMRFVSFTCNFWTIFLAVKVIYQLGKQIVKHKRENPDGAIETQLKSKLYLTSISVVSLILV